MFSRLTQLTRHLSRPSLSATSPVSSSSLSPLSRTPSKMTSSAAAVNATKTIHTAACLIIGDEVLGGKVGFDISGGRFGSMLHQTNHGWSRNQTIDTNSSYFAKYCFQLGIQLKRIEVIADDESEIVEAVRRMSSNYDFVVTSGGIGPTFVYPFFFFFF